MVLKKAAKFGTSSVPGIFIGCIQHVGDKWAHDYLVCPLEDFGIENASHTCHISRIREVIPDCSMVDLYSTGFIFPLRAVKDQMTRTLCPHGDSIEVSFPRRGSMGKVPLSNKTPRKTTVVKVLPDSQAEPEDYGSGARRRRANTTRPFGFHTQGWIKITKAQREEIVEHVPSQAASSSSGPQIEPIPETTVVSVPAVSANFPVVTTVGGVCAKMRSRQTKQQSNDKETSDAVVRHKVKAAGRTIGIIIKPTTKKTGYVKRNIVEFCCGQDSKISQSRYQRDGCTVTRLTLEDDVSTSQGLYRAIEAVRSENCLLWTSVPCTGGSPWQDSNVKKPGGLENIRKHKRLFNKIWTSFRIVANESRKDGGRLAIEWPKGCEYWRTKHVKQYGHDLRLNKVHVKACALGLTDDEGAPISKPWTIATDDPYV